MWQCLLTVFHLCVYQLQDVSQAIANVNTVLRTDLSNIVQKVSVCLQLLLLLRTFCHFNMLFFSIYLQGYSSFNDTPRLVKEQTKNIVSGTQTFICVCLCVVQLSELWFLENFRLILTVESVLFLPLHAHLWMMKSQLCLVSFIFH